MARVRLPTGSGIFGDHDRPLKPTFHLSVGSLSAGCDSLAEWRNARRFRSFAGPATKPKGPTFKSYFAAAQRIVELRTKRSSAPTAGSRQLAEQAPRLFEIGGGEALGEPAVDWGEQFAGCGAATLV